MNSALITGIQGFAGSYLCHELLSRGQRVSGLDRQAQGARSLPLPRPGMAPLAPEQIDGVEVFASDMSDMDQLADILRKSKANHIYHLAGAAYVPDSWKNPAATLQANSICALTLLQAARSINWRGRYLFISSSDVYGTPTAGELPLTEDSPIRPESPYSLSKYTAEEFARFYNQDGIEVVIARPFNHIGPGQRGEFVVPSFLERIEAAARSGEKQIRVGEMGAVRDFTDVRDVVTAYATLLEKGESGAVYNICSGNPKKIGDILDLAIKASGHEVRYEVDPKLLRGEGANQRYGNCDRLTALGWRPRIALADTIRDMYHYMIEHTLPQEA
ncbi:MAG: GDP-mannose 4,6-dehydratase [Leptospirales bacterium]|jgi:GDP-4-dehydro-6-deoxy-D-mannose reductase